MFMGVLILTNTQMEQREQLLASSVNIALNDCDCGLEIVRSTFKRY